MILTIKCPECRGPMWEESLPDTPKVIDLVCIICGLRKFYGKREFLGAKKRIEDRLRGRIPTAQR